MGGQENVKARGAVGAGASTTTDSLVPANEARTGLGVESMGIEETGEHRRVTQPPLSFYRSHTFSASLSLRPPLPLFCHRSPCNIGKPLQKCGLTQAAESRGGPVWM